jgi:hypothetical protein
MQGTMSHSHPPPNHQFFILGLRRQATIQPGELARWRISLEDSHTAERSGFRTLAELTAFLQAWMDERAKGVP